MATTWPRKTLAGNQACVVARATLKQAAGDAGAFERGDLLAETGGGANATKYQKIIREDTVATDLAAGTTKPVAVVYDDEVDATKADQIAMVVVLGDVREQDLNYPANTVTAEKRKILAALREVGIHTRTII